MRRAILLAVSVIVATHFSRASDAAVHPFERETWPIPANGIDERVLSELGKRGIAPANACSDAVFFRRVHLDVIGVLPEPDAVREFLVDARQDKRAQLIEQLLASDQFVDYWTLKWCDLLRVKAEFPINLWPNAVQAYHRWIRTAVKENRPYDEFVRDLLTASGSNFRVPPVNFYRAVQNREPTGLAEAVALTFMGTRTSSWSESRLAQMTVFFSYLAFKGTDEWKEQIVHCDLKKRDEFEATFPDGASVRVRPDQDPRAVFADWLVNAENQWFKRNIANRVWSWLMGRGIIHEPDDIRPDNPPVHPDLLEYLENELVKAQFDLKHLFRMILNSRTYQQSPVPTSTDASAERMFACYPVRRLDAEVLVDALNWVGGRPERYESRIPEPFTWIPEDQRTVRLADGSITSTFLQMFGRPSRDTGLESERSSSTNDAQRLFMLNSTDVYNRITKSIRLRRIAINNEGDRSQLIQGVYLTLLSRLPTPGEASAADTYWETPDMSSNQAAVDLAWALINSMEFLYRH